MLRLVTKVFCLTCLTGLVLVVERGASAETAPVEFAVELRDPLRPTAEASVYPIRLTFDDNGFPNHYQMPLQTAVCMHDTCKPIQATLYWDALGRFHHLEYPENWPITKYDHRFFTPEDYANLDRILKDKNSLLGIHPLDFFVAVVSPDAVEVDGVSSATPLAVKDAVVKDAAYTSWVLWHWVNGEIAEKLRTITRAHCTDAYMAHCLHSSNKQFVSFALNELFPRKSVSPLLREACLQVLEFGDWRNSNLAIRVLTDKSVDIQALQQEIVARFGVNTGSSSVILRWLEQRNDVAPEVWEELAARLQHAPNYFDSVEALTLLENRAADVAGVRKQIHALTMSDDIDMAKRATEFLGE